MSKSKLLLIVGMLLTMAMLFSHASLTRADAPSQVDVQKSAAENNCSLLDNPAARERMGGMFETKLLLACGRANELGQVSAPMTPEIAALLGGVD
ncbi:MAG: hypothetical protein KC418_13570, partial [Anaerolineales bacterium]|nr:hypothetical protein [Anaerolineales bacterium]